MTILISGRVIETSRKAISPFPSIAPKSILPAKLLAQNRVSPYNGNWAEILSGAVLR